MPMKSCFLLLATVFAWAQQPPPPAPVPLPNPVPHLSLPSATAAPEPTVPPDTVVITVGDTKITRAQFDQILATIPPPQRAQFSTPAGRRRLAEQIAELDAMAQVARERKFDQDPDVQLRVNQALAQKLYQELMSEAKPDDAALHAYYDAHKAEFEEVKAKHILIRVGAPPGPPKPDQKNRTDAEALAMANDIRAKILAGGNWDELAKAYSDDTANAQNGGELGTFGHGRMVPQFEKAAFDAETGKVTQPVKTQFGYHLILVEEHKSKPFEEAKTQIEQKIKPEMAQKSIDEIKSKANIKYDDTYFAAPPALPPVPTPPKPPAK